MNTQMVYIKSRKPHYHDDELEVILVLRGKITIHKVERVLTIGEGEFTFINRHIVHYIESEGAYILTSKIHLADFRHIFDKIEYVEFLNNDEVVEAQRPLKDFLNTVVIDSLVKDYLLTNKQDSLEDKMFNENYLVDVLFSCYQLISHIKKEIEHPTEELQQRYYFIVQYITTHLNEKIMVNDILKYVYMNPTYFSQFMKKIGGVGFKEFISYRKLIMILTFLIKPDYAMTDIASSLGMGDMKAFYSIFKRYFHMSPAKWREQALRKKDEYVVCMDDYIIHRFIERHHVGRQDDNSLAKLYKNLCFANSVTLI